MPEFLYKGISKEGKGVEGKLEAPNEGELRMILRSQGIRPTKIAKPSLLNSDLKTILGLGGSIPIKVMIPFTRQLQVLISAGIPLIQALDLIIEQSSHHQLKIILFGVRERVSQGSYFWQALSAYPKAFPKLFVALIRAGESAGALDIVLKRLSRYLEDSDRISHLVRGAMMYPILVFLIGGAVIALMLVFVIPKFEEILADSGQDLPLITQLVIDFSHAITSNIGTILIVLAASATMGVRYFQSDEGRSLLQRMVFRAPLFGELAQKSGVARFSRTMATLLSSGVNLIDAIDICRMSADNVVLEEAIGRIKGQVQEGKAMGGVIAKLGVFPSLASQLISVGESTGHLDKMMDRIADVYESEVEILVSGMSKLIEPIVIVVLGVIVGGLMITMYLPIFQLAGGGDF